MEEIFTSPLHFTLFAVVASNRKEDCFTPYWHSVSEAFGVNWTDWNTRKPDSLLQPLWARLCVLKEAWWSPLQNNLSLTTKPGQCRIRCLSHPNNVFRMYGCDILQPQQALNLSLTHTHTEHISHRCHTLTGPKLRVWYMTWALLPLCDEVSCCSPLVLEEKLVPHTRCQHTMTLQNTSCLCPPDECPLF